MKSLISRLNENLAQTNENFDWMYDSIVDKLKEAKNKKAKKNPYFALQLTFTKLSEYSKSGDTDSEKMMKNMILREIPSLFAFRKSWVSDNIDTIIEKVNKGLGLNENLNENSNLSVNQIKKLDGEEFRKYLTRYGEIIVDFKYDNKRETYYKHKNNYFKVEVDGGEVQGWGWEGEVGGSNEKLIQTYIASKGNLVRSTNESKDGILSSKEMYTLANALTKDDITKTLKKWATEDGEKMKLFKSLVKMGDSEALAMATAIGTRQRDKAESDMYRRAFLS